MKSESSANCSQGACPGLRQGIAAWQHVGTIRRDPGGLGEKVQHSADWSGDLCSEKDTLE